MAVTLYSTDFMHQHERIASRGLRYQGTGTGGTAYSSCESIGVAIPSPPDQTYGIGTRPQLATATNLPIGSSVTNTLINMVGVFSFPIGYGLDIRLQAGTVYHCGYITDCQNDGVNTRVYFSTTIGAAALITAAPPAAGSGVLYTYSSNADLAAMPTANVLITTPTFVEVEFTPGDLVNPADPPARELCEVKVLRRSYIWTGALGYLNMDTGLTLPCTLEPGYYAFKAQSSNWASHPAPSTDKTNADASPFVITFDRPRYVCDLGRNIKQKDYVAAVPPGAWDHQQGMGNSKIETATAILPIEGLGNTTEDNLIKSVFATLSIYPRDFSWETYPHLILGHNVFYNEAREAVATAYHFWNNQHHIGEQVIQREWLNTFGEIADVKDSSNRGAEYPAGLSSDLFINGSCDLAPGDIIRIGATESYDYCMVDSVEPYFGDPTGSGTDAFYTLVLVYPSGTSSWVGQRIYKLLRTNRLGRWVRYDADWTNLTVIKECTIDTTRDADGQFYLRRDSGKPPGAEYVVEYDETSGVWRVELPDGYIPAAPVVVLADGSKIACRLENPIGLPLAYPIPGTPAICYLIFNAGDKSDKNWLIFNPDLGGVTVWAQYQYYSDDCFIQEFWEIGNRDAPNDLWACEKGNGLLLRYNATNNDADITQDLGRGQTELGAKPKINDAFVVIEEWLSTQPSGYLSLLSIQHAAHIDRLPIDMSVSDAIGQICKAMDASPYVDGNGRLHIIARNGAIEMSKPLESVRYPQPAVSWGIQSQNIRVNYYGGVSQANKHKTFRGVDVPIVETFAHANYLSTTIASRATKGSIAARITVEEWENQLITLNDIVSMPYPSRDYGEGAVVEGQIIGISPQLDKQSVDLNIRRL